jgi:hypothetical protein
VVPSFDPGTCFWRGTELIWMETGSGCVAVLAVDLVLAVTPGCGVGPWWWSWNLDLNSDPVFGPEIIFGHGPGFGAGPFSQTLFLERTLFGSGLMVR